MSTNKGALEQAVEAMTNPDLPIERRRELRDQALAAAAKLRTSRETDPDGAQQRHAEVIAAIQGPTVRSKMTVDEKIAFVDANGSDAFLALPS